MTNRREILRVGLPLALSGTGSVLVSFVDIAVVGHYSTATMAGVAAAATFYDIVLNLLLASVVGIEILGARFSGADERSELASLALSGLIGALAFAGLLTGIVLLVGTHVLHLLSDGAALAEATAFLRIRAWGLPFEAITVVVIAVFAAMKRTRVALVLVVIENVANLGLDFPLVYGKFGMPEMGATGDAVASVVGIVLAAVVACIILWRSNIIQRQILVIDWSIMRRAVRLATPPMLSSLLDYAGISVFFVLLARGSTAEFAATRAAYSAELLVFVALSGLATGAMVVIGNGIAAQAQRLRRLHRDARATLFRAGIGAAVIVSILTVPIAFAFTDDAAVRRFLVPLLFTVCATCIPMGLGMFYVSTLRAYQMTGRDMVANTIAVWVFWLPVCAFLVVFVGAVAGFASLVVLWAVRMVLSAMFLRGKTWSAEQA